MFKPRLRFSLYGLIIIVLLFELYMVTTDGSLYYVENDTGVTDDGSVNSNAEDAATVARSRERKAKQIAPVASSTTGTASTTSNAPICSMPSSWSYVAPNRLGTVEGTNLSPWNIVSDPTVMYEQGKYRMWYTAADGRADANGDGNGGIAYAESSDGITWNTWKKATTPTGLIDLVLSTDATGWDGTGAETASVMRAPTGELRMYYTGNRPPAGSNHFAIGLATSSDGVTWKKYGTGPIFSAQNSWELPQCTNVADPKTCTDGGVLEPSVLYDEKTQLYKMWYAAVGTLDGFLTFRLGYATSRDGIQWSRQREPVFAQTAAGTWNDYLASHVNVVADPAGGYHLFYFGAKISDYCETCSNQYGKLGHAYSADGIVWQQDPTNPILAPRKNDWDAWTIGGPSAVIKDGVLQLWYFGQAHSDSITDSGIGLVKAVCQ